MTNYAKKCGYCGKKFTTTRPQKKYCTNHCSYVIQKQKNKMYYLKRKDKTVVKQKYNEQKLLKDPQEKA